MHKHKHKPLTSSSSSDQITLQYALKNRLVQNKTTRKHIPHRTKEQITQKKKTRENERMRRETKFSNHLSFVCVPARLTQLTQRVRNLKIKQIKKQTNKREREREKN